MELTIRLSQVTTRGQRDAAERMTQKLMSQRTVKDAEV